KIIAFGGDTLNPEASWGALQMAKRSAAIVLSEKITKGWYTECFAKEVLDALFYKNGLRLWTKK
ncbi:MAG: hypothetical protein KOO69_04835, partial [Victivallales bacterium]|nr:hypothetical protein [Victivallales bacterium]